MVNYTIKQYLKPLFVLILLEVFLVLIYLLGIVLRGQAFSPFDLDGQMTIPSCLQALQLFLIGLLSLALVFVGRNSSQPPTKIFALTVALLFFYASIDELFKVHLQLHTLLPTIEHRDWQGVYLAIGVTTIILFFRDFIALWHFHRKSTLMMVLGIGIFVLGGFGLEIFKDAFLSSIVGLFVNQGNLIPLLVEKLRVAVEEFSEMLGESLILYGLCLFFAKRLVQEGRMKSR